MHEDFEFRIDEDFVARLFRGDEGEPLGSIRKIRISPNDDRFTKIGQFQREVHRETDRSFFYSWEIRRHYIASELETAKAFHLTRVHTFEPCGEQCGTIYDEDAACPQCGAGAPQPSDLRLDLRKAPKNKDIARTIAGEVIVSQRLAELMSAANLNGFEFRRVRHKALYEDDPLDLSEVPSGREILLRAERAGVEHASGKFYVWANQAENAAILDRARHEYAALKRQSARAQAKAAPVWHQLVPTVLFNIVLPTRAGIDPFDDDEAGEYRCPRGDTLGLNLLSELTVSTENAMKWDVAATQQYLGARQGVLRPERRLLVSPRFRRLLEQEKIKGYRIEIAHVA